MYPKSRYAAKGVCFECHVVAWQYALHESVELSAGFDSWSRALAGADHGAHGGGDRCVFGIERMYRDITRRCAVCGRSLHSRFLFCQRVEVAERGEHQAALVALDRNVMPRQ